MSEKEFMTLINKHNGIISKVYNTYCHGFSEADLRQEIILETWRSINSFKNNCTFSTWLYAIARNVCISNLRKHKKQPTIEGLEEYAETLIAVNNAPEMVRQLRNAMRYDSVLDNVDPAWRSVFQMYIEGISFKEMEEQTGVEEGTLRVNIHRIKKRLYLRYGKSESIK